MQAVLGASRLLVKRKEAVLHHAMPRRRADSTFRE